MKNTLTILEKLSETIYEREENNLAYVDEDNPDTYYINHTVGELCYKELKELKEQLEIWEEVKKVATMEKVEISPLIKYIFMQLPLNSMTSKIFENEKEDL